MRFVKLTTRDQKPIWFNPQHIVLILENENPELSNWKTAIYTTDDNIDDYFVVLEPVERVAELINDAMRNH